MNKKQILILCTGNSCRSQMAEGVLRHYGNDHLEVYSAGSIPSIVNPTAIEVMKEIGIDISKHTSKHLDQFKNQTFDTIITVCDNAKESCPVFPGTPKQLHWGFADPPHSAKVTEEVINEFRKIRDQIHEKFKEAATSGFFHEV